MKYLMIFLLMVSLVSAEIVSDSCESVSPYDYEALMECQISSYAQSANQVMQQEANYLSTQIMDSTEGWQIDISTVGNYYSLFQYFFTGLIILVAMLNGYSFMMSSEDPTAREESKRTFKYILLAGVLIALLPLLINETYTLSNAVNSLALHYSVIEEDSLDIPDYIDGGLSGVEQDVDRLSNIYANIPLFTFSAKAYLASMNARHLLVLLLVSLSPIILLGIVFSATKEYGKLLAYLFILEIFYPMIAIIIIHFSLVLSGAEINLLIVSSALILAVVFHLILVLTTILKASVTVVNQIRYQGDS